MWEILPDFQAGKTWNAYNMSNGTGVDSVGTPSVIPSSTYGQRVYSRSPHGELLETIPDHQNNRIWNPYNITSMTSSPTLAYDPRAYDDGGMVRVYGVDVNGHLLEYIGAVGEGWKAYNLSSQVGLGGLKGTPTVKKDKQGMMRVYVRNTDGTLYEFISDGSNGRTWNAYDMNLASRAPSPMGYDVEAVMGSSYPEIYAVDTRGHLIYMVVDYANPNSAWSAYDISEATGLSRLSGRPAVTLDADGMRRVYVRDADGTLWEFVNDGLNSRAWNPYNLMESTGAPKTPYDPAVIIVDRQLRVYSTSTNGHVIEFIPDYSAGRIWNAYDITGENGSSAPGGGVAAVAAAPLLRLYQGPPDPAVRALRYPMSGRFGGSDASINTAEEGAAFWNYMRSVGDGVVGTTYSEVDPDDRPLLESLAEDPPAGGDVAAGVVRTLRAVRDPEETLASTREARSTCYRGKRQAVKYVADFFFKKVTFASHSLVLNGWCGDGRKITSSAGTSHPIHAKLGYCWRDTSDSDAEWVQAPFKKAAWVYGTLGGGVNGGCIGGEEKTIRAYYAADGGFRIVKAD